MEYADCYERYILYIPHGSDESCCYILKPLGLCKLYIPHGSDERMQTSSFLKKRSKLYIPHGSDERDVWIGVVFGHLCTLYPTWFR